MARFSPLMCLSLPGRSSPGSRLLSNQVIRVRRYSCNKTTCIDFNDYAVVDIFGEWAKEFGNPYLLNLPPNIVVCIPFQSSHFDVFMASLQVLTSEPEHIKVCIKTFLLFTDIDSNIGDSCNPIRCIRERSSVY